jgi:hypothetical protein
MCARSLITFALLEIIAPAVERPEFDVRSIIKTFDKCAEKRMCRRGGFVVIFNFKYLNLKSFCCC